MITIGEFLRRAPIPARFMAYSADELRELACIGREQLMRDTIEVVLYNRRGREKYNDGVAQAALDSALATDTDKAAIDAMCRTFEAYRISINPRWDGSIA